MQTYDFTNHEMELSEDSQIMRSCPIEFISPELMRYSSPLDLFNSCTNNNACHMHTKREIYCQLHNIGATSQAEQVLQNSKENYA